MRIVSEPFVAVLPPGLPPGGPSITTPVCIAQSHLAGDAFRIIPLSDVAARRQLVVVHRRDEFEPSVLRLRALMIEHLRETVQRACFTSMPWIVDAMEFDDEYPSA